MDLAVMRKRALLIPTPGQSEQEYLAGHLSKQGLFFWRKQALLDLEKDMAEALKLAGFSKTSGRVQHLEMRKVVDTLLGDLSGF